MSMSEIRSVDSAENSCGRERAVRARSRREEMVDWRTLCFSRTE